jgi:hypothetical protein
MSSTATVGYLDRIFRVTNHQPRNGNGSWRPWLLGIIGTIVVTLLVNGISFQRETRESIATNDQRIKSLETTSRATIIREFESRQKQLDDTVARLERRLDALERK